MNLALFFFCIVYCSTLFAQNTWGPITRPITRLHSALLPHSIGFENNLMNHISDGLRVDSDEIGKAISCEGNEEGFLVHRKGGRVIPIQCQDEENLRLIRQSVERFYGQRIGRHLKYAFRSGPFIFAVCNYDEKSKHSHSKHHYVCRTPVDGLSKEGDIETYCYEMGTFHRTCNPHKALVSTEIILINSMRRWADIDLEILLRFIGNHQSSIEGDPTDLFNSLAQAKIQYSDNSRGSPDSDARYPKVYFGDNQIFCTEDLVNSSSLYVTSNIVCGNGRRVYENGKRALKMEKVLFQKQLQRLKQDQVIYPMLGSESSSVEF